MPVGLVPLQVLINIYINLWNIASINQLNAESIYILMMCQHWSQKKIYIKWTGLDNIFTIVHLCSFEEEMLSCEDLINQLFDEDSDVYVSNSNL